MAVSKSAPEYSQDIRIGRRRNLSRWKDIILLNDTIKEQNERRRFQSRCHKVFMLFEIYLNKVGGQLPESHFY
jgi:hypothetical protein